MYTVPNLPYKSNALEPHIDAKTMEIHHGKHHGAYVAKLNDAVKAAGQEFTDIEDLVKSIDGKNAAIRNNAGGHINHSLFWPLLSAHHASSSHLPSGSLAQAINKDFGSFNAFKEQFSNAAATRFGSGWAWLCLGSDKKLLVGSTPNQDNPLMPISDLQGRPIIGLDVWEHAYYLNYQNRRPDYIQAFWNVLNWQQAEKNFQMALS